jgi:hypothetical protein
MNDLIIARGAAAHRGKRLEYFTIAWNTLEGLIGIGAGTLAGSISLVGFGIDSRARLIDRACEDRCAGKFLDGKRLPRIRERRRVAVTEALNS